MAKARFHSLRGEKSVLIGFKPNELQIGNTFVYLSRAGVLKAINKKEEDFESNTSYDAIESDMPDGYKLSAITDEDGKVRTTKEGEPLQTLVW